MTMYEILHGSAPRSSYRTHVAVCGSGPLCGRKILGARSAGWTSENLMTVIGTMLESAGSCATCAEIGFRRILEEDA